MPKKTIPAMPHPAPGHPGAKCVLEAWAWGDAGFFNQDLAKPSHQASRGDVSAWPGLVLGSLPGMCVWGSQEACWALGHALAWAGRERDERAWRLGMMLYEGFGSDALGFFIQQSASEAERLDLGQEARQQGASVLVPELRGAPLRPLRDAAARRIKEGGPASALSMTAAMLAIAPGWTEQDRIFRADARARLLSGYESLSLSKSLGANGGGAALKSKEGAQSGQGAAGDPLRL